MVLKKSFICSRASNAYCNLDRYFRIFTHLKNKIGGLSGFC
uniref:Uncharacterized protein n=1 Tax=Anguilla anguilla TaxID=7936 RepID=A0A0E9VHQ7_ANGAN